jgi:hypothetical protein
MDIHITRKGEQHGPYPEASAREMLAAGQLLPTDLAWHAGADGWKPLGEVLGVGAQPAATPSPPPKPPGAGIPKRTMAGAALAEEKPAEEKSEDSEAEDPDKIRVTRKGEPIGPYSREKAEKYFTDGQLLPTDWGWHDGMDNWKPLYEVLGVEVPAQTAAVATGKPGKGKKVALIVGIVVLVAGLGAAGYFFLYPMLKGGGVASAIDTNGTDTNETDPASQPGAPKNEIVGTYMWDTSPFSQVGSPLWVELNEGGAGNFFVGPINSNRPAPPKPIIWQIDPENSEELIVNMDAQVFLRARITPGGGLKLLEFAKEQGQEAELLDAGEQIETVKKGTLVGQYAGGGGNQLMLRKDQKAVWVINRQTIQGTWYVRHNPGSIKGEVLFFGRQAQFLFSINSGQKPVSLTSAASLKPDPATRSMRRVPLPTQGQMTYTRSKGGPGGGRPPGGGPPPKPGGK